MAVVNSRFVTAWAAEYERHMGLVEPWLLGDVGPVAASRGFYEPDEFVAIARWETPRSKKLIAANPESDVREVTRMAFAASEQLQHRLLTVLSGVHVRTATALLTVAFPEHHTVLDIRSTEALLRLKEWDGHGGYPAYLVVCRAIAKRLKVDLRTLDRALWQWSKVGYPPPIFPPDRGGSDWRASVPSAARRNISHWQTLQLERLMHFPPQLNSPQNPAGSREASPRVTPISPGVAYVGGAARASSGGKPKTARASSSHWDSWS